jgi:hypothetical protein
VRLVWGLVKTRKIDKGLVHVQYRGRICRLLGSEGASEENVRIEYIMSAYFHNCNLLSYVTVCLGG